MAFGSMDVVMLLRRETEKTGQKAWAERAGVSPAYVNDVLHLRREPGKSICDALGLERIVKYRYKLPKQRARNEL